MPYSKHAEHAVQPVSHLEWTHRLITSHLLSTSSNPPLLGCQK